MSAGILDRIDSDLIEPQRLAACVVDQLKIERHRPPRNGPRGISTREALLAIVFETQLVALCAENMAQGIQLSTDDRARLLVAWARIDFIYSEVVR